MSDRLKMTASEEASFTEAFRRSPRRVDGAAVTAPADTIEPCRFEPGATQAENELICERLLGWAWQPLYGQEGLRWRPPNATTSAYTEDTLAFDDWHGAGMILEALAKRSNEHPRAFPFASAVGFDPVRRDWSAGAGSKSAEASTGPLAIRAAALSYLRSLER